MAEAMLTNEATPREETIVGGATPPEETIVGGATPPEETIVGGATPPEEAIVEIIFTEQQKKQLWGIGKKITTICWFWLVVWYEDGEIVLRYDPTKPEKKKHAEIIALNSMKKYLEENKSLLNQNKVIIDIKLWMNNSPCFKCQERIFSEFQGLRMIVPTAKTRFIIFFSSFFKKPNNIETCLENLNDFFENLFLMDITVIAGLILVTKTVPEPKLNKKQRKKIEKREKNTLRLFRLLFTNVNTRSVRCEQEEYITIPSLNMLEDVRGEISPFENPHFAICRSDSPYLAPLILILGTLRDLHFEEQEQQDEEQENSDRRDEEKTLAPSSPPTIYNLLLQTQLSSELHSQTLLTHLDP